MTEKRFTLSQNGTFHSVQDNVENKPLGVFEFKDDEFPVYACFHRIIDLMNNLSDENEQLRLQLNNCSDQRNEFHCGARENANLVGKLEKENDQLKISSTMYHNLFKEFQRQMQGVKSIYDLDSKDFEDLIELSKGNVFTDEIGWVHLPIKELQE